MEQSLHRTVQGQGTLALSPLFFIPPLAYPKQLCFGYVSCAVILWEEIRESKIVQNPSSAASSVNFPLDRISSYRKAAETIGSFFTLGFLIHSDCPRRGQPMPYMRAVYAELGTTCEGEDYPCRGVSSLMIYPSSAILRIRRAALHRFYPHQDALPGRRLL